MTRYRTLLGSTAIAVMIALTAVGAGTVQASTTQEDPAPGMWSLAPITDVVPPDARWITDQTNTIRMAVPSDWVDVETAPMVHDDGSRDPTILATTDLAGFTDGFDIPGAVFFYLPFALEGRWQINDWTDGTSSCVDDGIIAYDDRAFSGFARQFSKCDGSTTRIIRVVAHDPDRQSSFNVEIRVTGEDGDDDIIDTILSSFDINVADEGAGNGSPAARTASPTPDVDPQVAEIEDTLTWNPSVSGWVCQGFNQSYFYGRGQGIDEAAIAERIEQNFHTDWDGVVGPLGQEALDYLWDYISDEC